MSLITLPLVLQAAKGLGYAVFERGDMNINLIGVRTSVTEAGRFDDWITCTYKQAGGWVSHWWKATTDPGAYYLGEKKKWLNKDGVAILVPGQYRRVYTPGPHGSTGYEALVQRRNMKVFRDTDLDTELDFEPSSIQEGHFGINMHASSTSPYKGEDDRSNNRVGAWSGGCQVFAREIDFRQMMGLVTAAGHIYSPGTTYTLLTEKQIRGVV